MKPNVALVVITDGRGKYLEQTVPSFRAACDFPFYKTILVDDSGDAEFHYRADELVKPDLSALHQRRMGGAAAIRSAWRLLRSLPVDYVFHLEDDWTFPCRVPVAEMVGLLDADSSLANVVLRRQSWGLEPVGGYIAADPDGFTQHYRTVDGTQVPYLVHNKGFWLNPGVYRADVVNMGWPAGGHEHHFSARVAQRGYRFAVYGTADDAPRCLHIGSERSRAWTW
jgi:hypothetical protein